MVEFHQGCCGFGGAPFEHISGDRAVKQEFPRDQEEYVEELLEMFAELAEFDKCLKLGLQEDFINRSKMTDGLRFRIFKSGVEQAK